MIDTLFFLIFIIVVIASVVKRAMDAARRVTGSKTWAEMTSVERKVQRELEEYVRKRKPAAGKSAEGGGRSAEKSDAYPVPPPLAPAPAVIAPTPAVVTSAPAVVAFAPPVMPPPLVSPHSALRAPHLPKPRRRPVRLNARMMSRVAILSEIWRPPLALREGNPWDRT